MLRRDAVRSSAKACGAAKPAADCARLTKVLATAPSLAEDAPESSKRPEKLHAFRTELQSKAITNAPLRSAIAALAKDSADLEEALKLIKMGEEGVEAYRRPEEGDAIDARVRKLCPDLATKPSP